jgi:hypothetical protein
MVAFIVLLDGEVGETKLFLDEIDLRHSIPKQWIGLCLYLCGGGAAPNDGLIMFEEFWRERMRSEMRETNFKGARSRRPSPFFFFQELGGNGSDDMT